MGIAVAMKHMVEDIVSSREARGAEVEGLRKEADEMLGSFKASRSKMGAQLRRELTDDKATMGAEVKALRSGFQSSRREMSAELRGRLADYDREIKMEVAGTRQETKADLGEARTAWQELSRGKTTRRPTGKVAAEAVPAQKESPDLEAELLAAEAVPAQKESLDLEAELLAAIREHPEGITLTQVADRLGMVPIVFGRAAKKLIDEGKVRKEDKVYFSAPAE